MQSAPILNLAMFLQMFYFACNHGHEEVQTI